MGTIILCPFVRLFTVYDAQYLFTSMPIEFYCSGPLFFVRPTRDVVGVAYSPRRSGHVIVSQFSNFEFYGTCGATAQGTNLEFVHTRRLSNLL